MNALEDSAGMLTTSELAQLARPVPANEEERPPWVGSATSEVEYWRERALRAEGALAELRRRLVGW